MDVMKPTLFLYPKNEHKNIVISGFIKMTRNRRTINGIINILIESTFSSMPNETKNIVEKKFFNDATFPIMTRL